MVVFNRKARITIFIHIVKLNIIVRYLFLLTNTPFCIIALPSFILSPFSYPFILVNYLFIKNIAITKFLIRIFREIMIGSIDKAKRFYLVMKICFAIKLEFTVLR